MRVSIGKEGLYLIAPIPPLPTDLDLLQVRKELVEKLGRYHPRGVIVDVTPLDVVDAFTTRFLRTLFEMARLCGASTVLVGLHPEVACAVALERLDLGPMATAPDVAEGLALLERLTRRS